jgi:hypothetical protein
MVNKRKNHYLESACFIAIHRSNSSYYVCSFAVIFSPLKDDVQLNAFTITLLITAKQF